MKHFFLVQIMTMRKDEEENRNVLEQRHKLIFNCGRVRSKEDEEALDRKIAEIRRKNQLIERRREVSCYSVLSSIIVE